LFVPEMYRPIDDSWTVGLIQENPLAVLVTDHEGEFFATHVPIIIADDGCSGSLPTTLLGHMNHQNPHWERLGEEMQALLLFHGPQGYVSPSIYARTPAAPTWNFTAAHVYGKLSRINDREETFGVIRATAAEFERRFGQHWDMAASLGYFGRLLPGVGAFRVAVQNVESMFKLSQEQAPEVRATVADAFAESGSDSYRRMAAMMARQTRNGTG
jgi:transcriptional regulator